MWGNYYTNTNNGLYGVNATNRTEIIHVNGENGARAYQLPPNSNILLLDDTAPIVWLAQTDGAGYKTVSAYKIEPYATETIDIKTLNERISKLEEIINDKSDIAGTKRKSKNESDNNA